MHALYGLRALHSIHPSDCKTMRMFPHINEFLSKSFINTTILKNKSVACLFHDNPQGEPSPLRALRNV